LGSILGVLFNQKTPTIQSQNATHSGNILESRSIKIWIDPKLESFLRIDSPEFPKDSSISIVNGELPKSFSTRVQLKSIAMRFAEMKKMEDEFVCLFLLEVDRLKSRGYICDIDILISVHKTIQGRVSSTVVSNIKENGRREIQ